MSSTPIRIVRAQLDNPAHLRAAIHLLDLYARDAMGMGRSLSAQVKRRLASGLARHGAIVLLARRGGEFIGQAVCFKRYSTFAARPMLNVHDLIVVPAYRERGVGRLLLAAVEKLARRGRCCRITLEVRSDNAGTQSLYRGCGILPGDPPYEYWGKTL